MGGGVGVGGGSAVEQARERIRAVIRREAEISRNRLKSSNIPLATGTFPAQTQMLPLGANEDGENTN